MQTNILQQRQNSDNFPIILQVLKVMENLNFIVLPKFHQKGLQAIKYLSLYNFIMIDHG